MRVPELASYSEADLRRARSLSPALDRYLGPSQADELSRFRREHWVRSALATVLRTAPAEAVTAFWSDTADALLEKAWQEAGMAGREIALFALGKLGARELNLSSDVDLVLVSEPSDVAFAQTALRRFTQILTNQPSGSLLRLDFDLRPGGRFGPLITTPNQMRDYYWSQGETWERLAWVRARAVSGSVALHETILSEMAAFSYRRFLDFTVMEDLKLLRSRIHSSLSLEPDQVHLKLGKGGIRDLELFVHSLLIIYGGRRPELRSHSTTQALKNLETSGLLPVEDARFLIEAYWRLRTWENSVQAKEDHQTHVFRLSDASELISVADQESCVELCTRVDRLVSSLLGPVRDQPASWPQDTQSEDRWLAGLGVSEATAREFWPQLLSATALSSKTERDESARREFLTRYLAALREHGLDAELGLRTLLDFVKSIRAKATFFSLLLREPNLIRDLAHLFSVSPYLGQMISARPELLDSFLFQRQGPLARDWDQLLEELTEWRLVSELMAASQFLHHRDCMRLGRELSDTADQIINTLLTRLKEELGSTEARLLALGKWGGRELGVRSDLDFVVIVESEPQEKDHRLARRLISRLTEPHRGGRLYPIDMRLRPSGHAGPLLVSVARLLDYLRNQAAPWERQSYLRARVISGSPLSLEPALFARPLTVDDLAELRRIREKLLRPLSVKAPDLKMSSGGLVAIEFTAQLSALRKQLPQIPTDTLGLIRRLSEDVPEWRPYGDRIGREYAWLRTLEQLQQLTSFQSGSVLNPTADEFSRLAKLLNMPMQGLLDTLSERLNQVQEWLDHLDPLKINR